MPNLGDQCVAFPMEKCRNLTMLQNPCGRNDRVKWQFHEPCLEEHHRYWGDGRDESGEREHLGRPAICGQFPTPSIWPSCAMLILIFQSQASTLMGQWQSLALSSNQQSILATFGDDNSWSLTYNLYADLLLGTGLAPQSVSVCVVCAILVSEITYLGVRCSYELSSDSSEHW